MPRSITTTAGILAIAFIRTRPTLTETSEPSDLDAVELMRIRSSHGGTLHRYIYHRPHTALKGLPVYRTLTVMNLHGCNT